MIIIIIIIITIINNSNFAESYSLTTTTQTHDHSFLFGKVNPSPRFARPNLIQGALTIFVFSAAFNFSPKSNTSKNLPNSVYRKKSSTVPFICWPTTLHP